MLQVKGNPAMSTLKAMIAQNTGVPGDLFGPIMGGKQLQTEERHRLIDIAKDTMITVTAGLGGGSPSAQMLFSFSV